MAAIKKNIWLIFYIIVYVGICLAILLSVYAQREVQRDATHEQEAFVKMAAISVKAHIDQYNIMFAALDSFLLRDDTYRSEEASRRLFIDVMHANPAIKDIGLFTTSGQQYISAVGLNDTSNGANISDSPYFQRYLSSTEMVIGRPFKHDNRNEYYIPFAKTLRSPNGEPLAILVVAVKTENGFVFINRNSPEKMMHSVSVVVGSDYHFLLVPFDGQLSYNPYENPVPKESVDVFNQGLLDTHRLTPEDLKQSEKPYSLVVDVPRFNRTTLSTSEYIKAYDLWVSMHRPINDVWRQSIPYFVIIWAVLFVVLIALYLLFRTIHRFEEKKRQALNYQANHDFLTGLNNQFYLSGIKEELETPEHPFWLVSLDLNNFKAINDQHGHLNGDKILKQVALRLKSTCQQRHMIVRYSGDEFIIICHVSELGVTTLAKDLKAAIEQPINCCNHRFQFQCNLGMAHYPTHGVKLERVKQQADLARKESKRNHNQITTFNDQIKERYQSFFAMEAALTKAIEQESIFMVYQPQVDADGKLLGIESLVRWIDDELGFVPPDKFIAVAEQTDLMPALGWLIIQKSLEDYRELRSHIDSSFTTSINISALQFMQPDFANQLIDMVHSYSISPHEVTLEITESIFIEDIDFVLKQINTLKQQGFAFALDDFGTGFSSLSMLSQLPLDELKLDKSFIDPIASHQASEKMLSNIIRIGKDLDLKLVAEGVEHEEQKHILQQYDCELYQGYYFSRPLKKDDLLDHFDNNSNFPIN